MRNGTYEKKVVYYVLFFLLYVPFDSVDRFLHGTRTLDLHCKLNPLLFHIHTQNFHFHDIPDADDFQWMLDKAVTHLRDMYQTILMDSDIHKGTEINDISHGSLQYHARSQIFDLEHVTAQDWFWHILTRITGRRFQFLYDIPESQFADFQILCKLFVIPDFFEIPATLRSVTSESV